MIHDYRNLTKRRQAKPSASNNKWHWYSVSFVAAATIMSMLLVGNDQPEAAKAPVRTLDMQKVANSESTKLQPDWEMDSYEIALPPITKISRDLPATAVDAPDSEWQRFIVKPGYNMAIICSRAGVKPSELHTLMQLGEPVAALSTLHPDDAIEMKIKRDGSLIALRYDIHQSKRLLVTRKTKTAPGLNPFQAEVINRPLEIRMAHASGTITDSLFATASRAGLTDKQAIEIANTFEWDIDFAQDVRKGDRFTIVYEQYFRAGEKIRDGKILAAEFINNGRKYRAIRYTDPSGNTDYYSPDGRSIRKTFMRNPVGVGYISSHFNPRRKHPTLNKIRAHKGVDYAAPRGTPVRVTGDGKIVFRGNKRGYGKTIIVQHGQRYSTLYAHLKSFARNTRKGRKVKQGQMIGRVGKTGLATGPHLHYEFRVNGRHRNPLKVKHRSVAPIPESLKADFKSKAKIRIAQLETLGRVRVAMGDKTDSSSNI